MEDILSLVQEFLENSGFKIITAIDGTQGLEALKSQKIDLVITDLFMSPMPGIEFIVKVKEKYPAMKIIAMSASVGKMNFLQVAKQMGALRIVEKPVEPDELLKVIKEVL